MKNFVDSSRPLKKAKTYKEREDVSIQLAATEMHLGFLRHMWDSHVSDWSKSQDKRLHMQMLRSWP